MNPFFELHDGHGQPRLINATTIKTVRSHTVPDKSVLEFLNGSDLVVMHNYRDVCQKLELAFARTIA